MNFLKKLFDWMLVIGLVLMFGRIITVIFRFFDIPFTTFFIDYSLISIIVLIVGVIGQQLMKTREK